MRNHFFNRIAISATIVVLNVFSTFAQRTVQDMLRPAFDSSEVIHVVIDSLMGLPPNNVPLAPQIASPLDTINYVLDRTRIVGEVPYELGTDIAGQVELRIPIETFASSYESSPLVAIRYNSLGGLSCMGRGWDITGVSRIETANKTFFTDGNVSGRCREDGPWSLDGNRLILQESNDTAQIFLTQTGNIKVVRDLNNGCFTAYMPDGSVCNYSISGGFGSYWCPSKNTALDDREVSYSYYTEGNHRLVKKILYGEGRSLSFSYADADNEQSSYIDGIHLVSGKKLSKIEVIKGDQVLRQYEMTYRDNDITAPLVQVDMLDSADNAVNPLHFYYQGDHASHGSDSIIDKYMSGHFSFQNPEYFIALRGKLDYTCEDDAVIIYPNKRNYYTRYLTRVRNDYNANDHLYINYNLNGFASTYSVLNVGDGFVDAFCMDVDGHYGEEFIKVNQNVYSNYDHVQFNVFQLQANGLIPTDTVNIYLNALVRNGEKSVWPTQFLTGDFTGDGRDDVLLCRTANPLNGGEVATVSMIDLAQEAITYSGTLDAFQLYIPMKGIDESLNIYRAKDSDRLFSTDLDGDGKLEMCVLNSNGLDIYRFNHDASGHVVMTKTNNSSFLFSDAYDYNVTVGDVNGDGNSDLIYLPNVDNLGVKAYFSRGDDTLMYKSIDVYSDNKTNLMCFDYNQDGQSDIVRYVKSADIPSNPNSSDPRAYTHVYTVRDGVVDTTYRLSRTEPTILVPMSFFGQNSNMAMLSIKSGGYYDIYRCSNPASMDALMVGLADSRGRISQMQYRQLYQGEYYSPGFNAVFPYSTYAGNMFVCSGMTKRSGNVFESDLSFNYDNATIHRQGLGFCGFRGIQTHDGVHDENILQTFSPENYGVPDSVDNKTEYRVQSYTATVTSDKRIKVLLSAETHRNKLTGVLSSSSYTHDSYGNIIGEMTTTGDFIKNVVNVYANVNDGRRWIIGAETLHTESISDGDQTIIDGRTTKYNEHWLPDTLVTWKGSALNAVSTRIIKYDDQKRPIRVKTRAYSGGNHKSYYDYQGTSRLPKAIVDENGLYNSLSHGVFGLTRSAVYPEWPQRVDDEDPVSPPGPFGPLGGLDGQEPDGLNVINPAVNYGDSIITCIHYDSFGRPDTTTVSDGTVKTVTYSWAGIDVPGALTMVGNTVSGSPASRVWHDALGRKVQTATQRFDGSWSKKRFLYDDTRKSYLVTAESQPFTGSAASLWTSFEYDTYDRLTKTQYPDSHSDNYIYNGLTTTQTIDGLTSSQTVDELGNVVAVTDGGGSIAYTLRPDGQPDEILVGGVVATTFEYDQYGRRTAINDPSAGRRTTTYDDDGNVSCETDARGMSVTSGYDDNGRVTRRTYSDGVVVDYSYSKWGLITSMNTNKGYRKSWGYNDQHKLTSETVGSFKKTFTYDGNQVASVGYYNSNTYICSENYHRQNGHVTSITLNTGDTIWTLREQDARFLPVRIGTGKLNQSFSYDLRGNVTSRSATRAVGDTIQWLTCSYSTGTGNMARRTDMLNGLEEDFGYDGMNRLTDISLTDPFNNLTERELLYDGKGNILSRTDAGQFGYNATLPYGLSELSSPANGVPMREQYLHYNAMQQPDTIIENGYTATFKYYGDESRAVMNVTGPDGYQYSCSYSDQRYNYHTLKTGGVTTHKSVLWLGGSPYTAPAALLKDYGSNTWRLVYALRDNLGSITHVVDTTGVVLQEMGYDAWGQLRNPQTGTAYGVDAQPVLLLGRGYTGHEHLPWFGLVNMNARLYDPAVGRFLCPDPIVQAPDNTQNFNRYSYCMNNPLKYTDSDGEFFLFTIFNAITDLFINVAKHGFNVSQYNWNRTVNAWKMDMGWFKGSFKHIVSRFLWEIPQTYLGYLAGNIPNTFGLVRSISYYEGATVIEHSASEWGAFTLGSYIIGQRGITANPYKSSLFQHEYGHYLQSQSVGPLYILGYALPSLIDATFHPGQQHDHFTIEQDANKRALLFYTRHDSNFRYKNWNFLNNPIDDEKWLHSHFGSYQQSPRTSLINSQIGLQLKDYHDSFLPYVKTLYLSLIK